MSLNTTPRTWVTSEIVTAAELNTEVRDALTGIQAAWTDYSGTITLSNITKGNGTLIAEYLQVGKSIDVFIQFTLGSTSAIGTTPTVSLPVTALRTKWTLEGSAFVAAVANPYALVADATSTTTLTLRVWPGTAGNQLSSVTAAVPGTWTTGNSFTLSGRYQAA